MAVEYEPYEVARLVNIHKHVDPWFWVKYSAHPYIGCQHGCEYCYWREKKYYPYQDLTDFARHIKVKTNAPALLRKELSRLPREPIAVGDWQPAEANFRLSRQMLEVCLDLGFPVFLLEKSHYILHDLDLIQEMNRKSHATVAFSIIATPESPHYPLLKRFEPHVPLIRQRFKAMKAFAQAGILTGTAFMPILPYIYDDEANLEAVVRWTRENGGAFVLTGGLTLTDVQKEWFLEKLGQIRPGLVSRYEELYTGDAYGPPMSYWAPIGQRLYKLCQKHGLSDRMPRYIPPGPLATNRRLAEYLADKTYRLELAQESTYRIWAYRKAWWALDDLEEDVRQIYEKQGKKGLMAIKAIGKKLTSEIALWLEENEDEPGDRRLPGSDRLGSRLKE
jgi:DNA repair photolyase